MIEMTLKALRINKRMRQTDVANALNVSISTIKNWESGKTFPKPAHIDMLCALYNVSYDNIKFVTNE